MADNISAQFWMHESDYSMHRLFKAALDGVESWSGGSLQWQDFAAYLGEPEARNRLIDADGPLDNRELTLLMERSKAKTADSLQCSGGVPCLRWSGGAPESGWASLYLNAYGAGSPCWRVYRPREMNGDAEISICPVNPYFVELSPESVPGAFRYNEMARKNLAEFRSLFLQMVKSIRPFKAHVFDTNSLALPFNSHAAYYSGPEAVLQEVAWLRQVWTEGLHAGWRPPFRDFEKCSELSFSGYRSYMQKRAVWSDLTSRLFLLSDLTELHVEKALEATTHEIVPIDAGYVVFSDPDYMNGFVHGFLLDVLDLAILDRDGL